MAKTEYKKRVISEGLKQVNFNIPADLLDKVKDLAWNKNVSDSEIYREAVTDFIAAYEKKKKIKPRPPKGKGLHQV